MAAMTIAVPTDLDEIARLPDPVVRNLLITQRYRDLSEVLRLTIGGPDVNWSTFACWASKTAGESIRGEEVPGFVDDIVGGSEVALERASMVEVGLRKLVSHLAFGPAQIADLVAKIIRDVSNQIAEGNLDVYAELAPKFAEFGGRFGGTSRPTKAAIDDFLRTLRPGPVDQGGQDLLREAFSAYLRAKVETDEGARARDMLLGNALIGFHEQTRLQPRIEGALDAPVEDVVVGGITGLVRAALPAFVEDKVIAHLGPVLSELSESIEEVWERVATELFMQLALPGGQRLSLGKDLAPAYPAILVDVSASAPLVALGKQFDDGSTGADDWASLPDRMGFILTLFRNNARNDGLFVHPFSDDQRGHIERRTLPPAALGRL